ncbi:uncharacterized protein K452DRAFT_277397 [Aplosporella prunicola CBS 121167]|uniref:Alkaline phosphatase n=1 Tax=Aplosporella prunicola CBS 121167 TaxID=1176127 RepID=A0A6A6B3X2_9PEZI|nr:uncharacterized protein K452DRAFT_277397 [Aplosporella prunicola CBS 121167]KAF2138308.1 hypothetical protein K452DRAFT_277397 [Aplosporella prunicola CBS 121167]
MARSQEPLLTRRASDRSNDHDLAEEDALLTGEPTNRQPPSDRWQKWRELGLFLWALIATAAIIVLAIVYQKHQAAKPPSPNPTGKRNLIFMVSDGMGPTSLSLTRGFKQYQHAESWDNVLVLDKHMIGQSRTRSSSSLVTDSAAGATAFSCGFKSYNGAISVLPNHEPCGTVLEAAKRAGYMTGLVVTTRITDATPACFAAHVNMRSEEDRIAEQMVGDYPLGRVVDLMFGGGRCHFLPNTTEGSCRADDNDIRTLAGKHGFSYVDNREDFDGLNLGSAINLPMLGLFADHDIPYEVDRRNENDIYPSLDEMARTAMRALSEATRDSDKGFFLMIEGSRIDHAGHANDPVAQVHEVLAYDKTVASVLEFLEKDPVQGVMVSTSDHETGGLAAARQLHTTYPEYLWYPGVLANASHSAERLAQNYQKFLSAQRNEDETIAWLKNAVENDLGIHDASEEEINNLAENPDISPYVFADMVSRRSQTGWSTHGHSAADVNIFASDPIAASPLVGNHENTEVGEFLRNYLSVDVEAITKELRSKGIGHGKVDAMTGESIGWMGRMPDEAEINDHDHLDHYQGDFKKHKRCEICGM